MDTTQHDGEFVLVLNCGSSSLKYEIIQLPQRVSLGKGMIERIGEKEGRLTQHNGSTPLIREQHIGDHMQALELAAQAMVDPEKGILRTLGQIGGVGHRVVHGGDKYSASVIIDNEVIAAIEEFSELAPLHNPPNLQGIRAAMKLLPGVSHVAVFDTAFHQTMPPAAYLYGLPRRFYDDYKIRRYGFHGTSHRYVSARGISMMKRSPENTNVISCHLGNGASVTAIECGKSVDTSMGFTPLEGVMMGTRSGDIDPAIHAYLDERGYSPKKLNTILNKESGLLGISGISNDLRDLEEATLQGSTSAQEALEVYAYRIRKYIGSYSAVLVKVDALIFTGGIGQNGWRMRERICHRLENIGIFMNYNMNRDLGSREGIVSESYSPTTVMVVPTNEELQIAIDVQELAFGHHDAFRRRSTDVNL